MKVIVFVTYDGRLMDLQPKVHKVAIVQNFQDFKIGILLQRFQDFQETVSELQTL